MSATIKVLSHNVHFADIRNLIESKQTKSKLEADARKLKGTIDKLKAVLIAAMKGAPLARCGAVLITAIPEVKREGSLTLHDGRSIPLSDIAHIVLSDKTVIKAANVEKWFGGRTESADLEFTMVPE
jgi:hypothetical protein